MAVEWGTFEIDLDDIGGSAARNIPRHLLEYASLLLKALCGMVPADRKDWVLQQIRDRTKNQFRRECEAWAGVLGCTWEQVMLANCNYDTTVGARELCSVLALPTDAGPVMGRNLDWNPVQLLALAGCVLRYTRGGRHLFTIAGWPGSVGVVTGCSATGVAIALNYVSQDTALAREGTPVLLALRMILENTSGFEDAKQRAMHGEWMASGLVTVVGRDNSQMAVVERSNAGSVIRGPQNGRLVVTNTALGPSAPRNYTGCARYCSLQQHAFGGHQPGSPVSDSGMLQVLGTRPVLVAGSTASHVVIRPGNGALRAFTPVSREPGPASGFPGWQARGPRQANL